MAFNFVKQWEPGKESIQEKRVALSDVPGVAVGKSIVWEHGNVPTKLTGRERDAICEALGTKKINEPRCIQMKKMFLTLTCAQIAQKMKGRKGWSYSTLTKVHAALSAAKGEGAR